jgi:hypothetical protein
VTHTILEIESKYDVDELAESLRLVTCCKSTGSTSPESQRL